MAEGWARSLFADLMSVQSAGSRPTRVNPYAIEVMHEVGIDLRKHESKSVETIAPSSVDTVITLCAEEVCPLFLGKARRLHWAIPDPASEQPLGREEMLNRFRATRDDLRQKLLAWRDSGFT